MNSTRRQLLLGLATLVPAVSLLPGSLLAAEPAPMETLPLVLHSDQGPHHLEVEVALTASQRSRGLMDRDHLDPGAGMLFLYGGLQPSRNGFWMYRTRLPLDIAFIDENGRIVSLHRMHPCESSAPGDCPVTRPDASYRAALEVNAGYFEDQGIKVGDCVSWPGSGEHCAGDPS
ncbi:DUF192 domain-containing protein [Halomonas sp.]|uniref:DUF192 domain-containing protein n=1 Tax=Halomonas sp. TaxID=1486246 RepID=UPI00356732C3